MNWRYSPGSILSSECSSERRSHCSTWKRFDVASVAAAQGCERFTIPAGASPSRAFDINAEFR